MKYVQSLVYTPLRWFLKRVCIGYLRHKPMAHCDYQLYYPMHQHLNFLFQKEIAYEENIQRRILPLIGEGDLVFDIGANIGQYTLPFSQRVGATGRVISFEPNPEVMQILQLNLMMNHLSNVTAVAQAMGKEAGHAHLGIDTMTGGRMSSIVQPERFDATHIVEQTTLDEAVQHYGIPHLVKMDVEHAEALILEGVETPSIYRHTLFLIEVREESKADVFRFFDQHRCFCFENEKQVEYADAIPNFANLLFQPELQYVRDSGSNASSPSEGTIRTVCESQEKLPS